MTTNEMQSVKLQLLSLRLRYSSRLRANSFDSTATHVTLVSARRSSIACNAQERWAGSLSASAISVSTASVVISRSGVTLEAETARACQASRGLRRARTCMVSRNAAGFIVAALRGHSDRAASPDREEDLPARRVPGSAGEQCCSERHLCERHALGRLRLAGTRLDRPVRGTSRSRARRSAIHPSLARNPL